jgi:hypothetical protein
MTQKGGKNASQNITVSALKCKKAQQRWTFSLLVIVSITTFRFGGEGGIWTLAPVTPTYTLSRGAPSAVLGYFSMTVVYKTGYAVYSALSPAKEPGKGMAEREGFEPPVPFGITGFQDQLHKPLGHLSLPVWTKANRNTP